MKALVAILGLLVVGLGVGGGLFYKHATETETTLTAQLADAKHRGDALEADLSASKKQAEGLWTDLAASKKQAEGLSTDLAASKKQAEGLSIDLTAAKKQGESLSTDLASAKKELDETKAKLAEASAAGSKASQHSNALAGLLSRKTDMEKVITDDLVKASQKIQEAESALRQTPSKEAFDKLKSGYASVVQVIDKASPMLDELAGYMDKNKDALAGSEADVLATGTKVGKWKLALPELKSAIAKCQSAAREGSLGVYGNQGWQASDLSVEEGAVIAVAAKGHWKFAAISDVSSGPEGVNWEEQYRVVPDVLNGALIARIHGSERGHAALPSFQADVGGKVELRINDSQTSDNSGTVQATMWAFKPLE